MTLEQKDKKRDALIKKYGDARACKKCPFYRKYESFDYPGHYSYLCFSADCPMKGY